MRVYISVDMEGCSGIVHREHTSPKGYDYELARRLMTSEANAVIEAAFEGGASTVVVSDSHGGNGMRNLILTDMDERAEIVIGSPRRLGQLEGLDASFNAVLLIGYHTRHGAAGVLSHTTHGQAIANLWLNGSLVGEIGLNARLAGHFGVPVVMVSGDDLTIAEAKSELPECEGIIVKKALGRYAAQCLHPKKAQTLLKQGVINALQKAPTLKAFVPPVPVNIRLQFKETGSAESAARALGANLLNDDTVTLESVDMQEAYAAYSTLIDLWQPAWGAWERG